MLKFLDEKKEMDNKIKELELKCDEFMEQEIELKEENIDLKIALKEIKKWAKVAAFSNKNEDVSLAINRILGEFSNIDLES